jgi:hypothetical protein
LTKRAERTRIARSRYLAQWKVEDLFGLPILEIVQHVLDALDGDERVAARNENGNLIQPEELIERAKGPRPRRTRPQLATRQALLAASAATDHDLDLGPLR